MTRGAGRDTYGELGDALCAVRCCAVLCCVVAFGFSLVVAVENIIGCRGYFTLFISRVIGGAQRSHDYLGS